MSGLNALLRSHRLRAGLSQEELAHASGVSVRTIRNLETGNVEARPATRLALAKALGLTGSHRDSFMEMGHDHQVAFRDCLVPRELPPQTENFTGRDADRAWIRAALRQPSAALRARVVALHGPGGVGKSTLALQAAYEALDSFPDGQIFVDLHGTTHGLRARSPLEVLHRCLRSLGVAADQVPPDETEAAALFRSLTADQGLLIMLDNAAGLDQISPAIPASPHSAVLITSRAPLDPLGLGGQHFAVDRLTPADATALLVRTAARSQFSRAEADEIARYCDYLPLAVRLAGARLAHEPDLAPARLAAELTERRGRLERLGGGGVAVRASISAGYQMLVSGMDETDRLAAAAFRALGVVQLPTIEPRMVAAVTGTGEFQAAHDAVSRLARAQLVTPLGGGRHRMHDLVRIVAAECADQVMSEAERTTVITRALSYYLASARLAEGLVRPGIQHANPGPALPQDLVLPDLTSAGEVGPWLDGELANVLAAADVAASAEHDADRLFALRLSDALSWLLTKRGDWHRERDLAYSGLVAARAAGDTVTRARAELHFGRAELHLKHFASAREAMSHALAGFRAGDHLYGQAATIHDLAMLAFMQDDPATAHALLMDTFAIVSRIEPPVHKSHAVLLFSLGMVQCARDEWDVAAESMTASLDLRRRSNDRPGEGTTLTLLGIIRCKLGRLDQAEQDLTQANAITQSIGDRTDAWVGLAALAITQQQLGRTEESLTTARKSLLLAQASRHAYGEAAAHRILALGHAASGRREEAKARLRQAEAIAARAIDPENRVLEALIQSVT